MLLSEQRVKACQFQQDNKGFTLLGAYQDARPQRDASALRKDGPRFPERFEPVALSTNAMLAQAGVLESLGIFASQPQTSQKLHVFDPLESTGPTTVLE